MYRRIVILTQVTNVNKPMNTGVYTLISFTNSVATTLFSRRILFL